jgi:hypothetical protein
MQLLFRIDTLLLDGLFKMSVINKLVFYWFGLGKYRVNCARVKFILDTQRMRQSRYFFAPFNPPPLPRDIFRCVFRVYILLYH